MPRRKVGDDDARRIRDRLRQVVRDRYDNNLAEFGRACDATHPAYTTWFRQKGKPTTPSVFFLLKLARDGRSRVSLDGLLVGPPHRLYRRFVRLTVRVSEPPEDVRRIARQLADLVLEKRDWESERAQWHQRESEWKERERHREEKARLAGRRPKRSTKRRKTK